MFPCVSSKNSEKGTVNLDSDLLNNATEKFEKMHFSVFDRVDDIEVSEKKYSAFNSLVGDLLPSDLFLRQCLLCKDIAFAKALHGTYNPYYCKICKLKNTKNSTKNEKSLKYAKIMKSLSLDCEAYRKKSSSNSYVTAAKRNLVKKSSSGAVERRRFSLECKLKKICISARSQLGKVD